MRARRRRSPARADANSVPGLGAADADARGGGFVGQAGQESGWGASTAEGSPRRRDARRLALVDATVGALLAVFGLRWAVAALTGFDALEVLVEPAGALARSVDALTALVALYAAYRLLSLPGR